MWLLEFHEVGFLDTNDNRPLAESNLIYSTFFHFSPPLIFLKLAYFISVTFILTLPWNVKILHTAPDGISNIMSKFDTSATCELYALIQGY